MAIEEYWNKDFLKWFKENTPKEGLSENTTFSKQFVYDAYIQGRVDEDNSNKWHYVKDGDLPKDMENVFINAFDYGINTCYVAHRLNGKWRSNCSSEIFVRVIAWKEIVLPELTKEIK